MKGFCLILFLLTPLFSHASEIYFRGEEQGHSCQNYMEHLEKDLKEHPSKTLLFYIHGRGKHPEKGIAYLPDFEDRYGIKVVMFHWDSWIDMISRPEKSAINSGPKLKSCLDNLAELKRTRPNLFSDRNVFLMAHSMGNIVLKNLLENYKQGEWQPDFFDSVIFNAPDVDADGHAKWLDQANDFSKKIYVTFNGDDFILLGSKAIDFKDMRFFRGSRLGASVSNTIISPKELSKYATYLDFSNISFGGHRYFLPDFEEESGPIPIIYQTLFSNRENFSIPFSTHKNGSNILVFHPAK